MQTALATPPLYSQTLLKTNYRIQSIDMLRGLVMVLMALDHVRDYFHAEALVHDPLDYQTTTPAIFLTRWITHYCAPTFVFLSGISAYLSGSRGKTKGQLAGFLLTRGLWLIFLEVTLVTLGWTFDIQFRLLIFQVIWAIGLSMVLLAGLVYLPRPLLLGLSLLLLVGHNSLDPIAFEKPGWQQYLWAGLHDQTFFQVSKNLAIIMAYPVIPWLGLMLLGYYSGQFYEATWTPARRHKILLYIGLSFIALFLILRSVNGYGDSQGFDEPGNSVKTFYDFLNTTKYPPSLHYVLMTLGPALLLLLAFERIRNKATTFLITIGKVPLFYYLLHIYLIHGLAVLAAFATGFTYNDFNFASFGSMPKGYGFSLPVTYAVWVLIVALLYPLCHWYGGYKSRHRDNIWLSYL